MTTAVLKMLQEEGRPGPPALAGHVNAAPALTTSSRLKPAVLQVAELLTQDSRGPNFRDVGDLAEADPEKILAVDEAVRRLEADDPEAAAVVRLRFYAGLSVD